MKKLYYYNCKYNYMIEVLSKIKNVEMRYDMGTSIDEKKKGGAIS